ncbi:ABC-type sugar transport system, periplasmic component [Opitutaceae bacterium TAV1]|nr:ABC-type sugar transport system, periplasmic component [Opitutaceae bacterium TAV1]
MTTRSASRLRLAPLVGLALLLGCFAFATLRVWQHGRSGQPADGRIVVRFAHWQLESGLRDALDALAREYESLHPGVRIEQVPIPKRTYAQWTKTQLVGGTATDIIQIDRNLDDETLSRFYRPVTADVALPNPYNHDTPLAGIPWRDTFIDGMSGNFSYRPNLLDYYGVPLSMFTVRLYYNRDLWRQLLGDTPPPATYDGFIALCERIRKVAADTGRNVIPIAGSYDNGPILINKMVSGQTQRLSRRIDQTRTLMPAGAEIGLAWLRGAWNADTPAFADALAIARETSLTMQAGYEQLRHEDATFYFAQNRALMIATGSWDLPVYRTICPFTIGVFDVPLPARDHPHYGRNILGPPSEAGNSTGMAFGITRQSPHPDEALDFLRFLTSFSGNAAFCRASGWLPSVIDIQVPESVAPFLPVVDGYVAGFDFSLGTLGASTTLVMSNRMTLLVQPSGSVAAFQAALRSALTPAIREDLRRVSRNTLRNLTRQDVLLAGQLALGQRDPAGPDAARKISELEEAQNQQESLRAWIDHELDRNPSNDP